MRYTLLLLLVLSPLFSSHCEQSCGCCEEENPVGAVMQLVEKIAGERYGHCPELVLNLETTLADLFQCSGVQECPACTMRKTVLGLVEESQACCDHQLEVALTECVPLTSDLGRRLLKECQYQRDLLPLMEHFEVQQEGWWCGVATATMVLNALPIPRAPSKYANYRLFTQERFFEDPTAQALGLYPTNKQGISLDQLQHVLNNKREVWARMHPMATLDLQSFRKTVKQVLEDPATYVVVNYSRSVAEQGSGAHFSPVAAYHPGVDAVLILDTAKFKYSPFWMPVELIGRAMNTADSKDPNHFRGYLEIGAN